MQMEQVSVSKMLKTHQDSERLLPLLPLSLGHWTCNCYCPLFQVSKAWGLEATSPVNFRKDCVSTNLAHAEIACDLMSSESGQNLQVWQRLYNCQILPASIVTRVHPANIFALPDYPNGQLTSRKAIGFRRVDHPDCL
jgi:hypothetical protein